MKLLTATSRTQGNRDNDFTFCVEGELVMITGFVCETDRLDPDGGCGCGRSFAGLNSGKATTTALVSDLDFTPEDAAEAIRSALLRSKLFDAADIPGITEELLDLADDFPVGTVVEHRLGEIRARD
ncbi:DUF7715 family protein [Streptomyces sp. NBC_00236]|uniref:DUF7715 family protein n=1 Tax=Streptomyces sp. NBC_00236 TaxID=2903639 RepID=UPI002E296C0F|nr:hypothetical protein [Streptomyces sp. NBC_00236]